MMSKGGGHIMSKLYFKYKGIKYGFCTKFIATDEFYEAWKRKIKHGTEISFSENHEQYKLLTCYTSTKDNKSIEVLVGYHRIKEITEPVYFGGITSHTQKLIDEQAKEKETGQAGPLTIKIAEQEKKSEARKVDFEENFNAWIIYILAMLAATIFKANIFLWVIITVWFSIYKTYNHN
jgi:hypothetical protein